MSSLKILAAIAATATVSLAMAQGVPPKPASDPAVGAGQRSTQNTPMGSTGTPGGAGASAQGSTAGSSAATTTGNTGATSSGSMNSGSSMNSSSPSTSSSDTMASDSNTTGKKSKRVAKADRN